MCWPYWGEAEEMPEEMGKVCEEGFQSTTWKGTYTYVSFNDAAP